MALVSGDGELKVEDVGLDLRKGKQPELAWFDVKVRGAKRKAVVVSDEGDGVWRSRA